MNKWEEWETLLLFVLMDDFQLTRFDCAKFLPERTTGACTGHLSYESVKKQKSNARQRLDEMIKESATHEAELGISWTEEEENTLLDSVYMRLGWEVTMKPLPRHSLEAAKWKYCSIILARQSSSSPIRPPKEMKTRNGPFTANEDKKLIEGRFHGKLYSEIATDDLLNRNANSLAKRYQLLKRDKLIPAHLLPANESAFDTNINGEDLDDRNGDES